MPLSSPALRTTFGGFSIRLPFCTACPSGTVPQLQKSLELLGIAVLLDVFCRFAKIVLPFEPDKLTAAEAEAAKINIANNTTKGLMINLTSSSLRYFKALTKVVSSNSYPTNV